MSFIGPEDGRKPSRAAHVTFAVAFPAIAAGFAMFGVLSLGLWYLAGIYFFSAVGVGSLEYFEFSAYRRRLAWWRHFCATPSFDG